MSDSDATTNTATKVSRRRQELSDFTRGMICSLSLHANWTFSKISRELDIPRTTVTDIVTKYKNEGKTSVSPRPGRPKKLSARDERRLVLSVRKNTLEPLRVHQQNLASATGNIVSLDTLRKSLQNNGVSSNLSAKKSIVNKKHKKI